MPPCFTGENYSDGVLQRHTGLDVANLESALNNILAALPENTVLAFLHTAAWRKQSKCCVTPGH
jgi:hypothetical protein